MISFASISASDRDGRVPRDAQPPARAGQDSVSGRPGRGELEIIQGPHRSVVRRALATSPLRLLLPANHGHAAWIYTSTFGGGLVDGDSMSLHVSVGRGASAFLSTQASTKVYRSPHGTFVDLRAEVDRDARLIVAPDPVVCFAASRYRQGQRFDLVQGAGLVLVDWVSSGRRASGERWAFEEYVSRTIVRYDGRLVLHDATALRTVDGDLAMRMGRFDVLALLVMVGPAMQREADAVNASVNQRAIERGSDEIVSVASLTTIGCVARVAGRSVEQVGRRLRQWLGFVPSLLGDDPWLRKW
jgi:urease accessory protein